MCCPAGGFFWKITISHFVCVALRAASILKNSIFCIYMIFFAVQNCLICLVLSLGSMLGRLVLKKYVECTSRRVKWTSGARVMTYSGSLGRSVARSFGRSVARSLGRSLDRSIARSIARSLDRSLDHSLDRLIAHSITRSNDRSIALH